jgi:ankyrin repeat protein
MRSLTLASMAAALLFVTGCEKPSERALRELKRENYRFTPEDFVSAASFGDTKVVERYLEAGMDVNAPDPKANTALIAAAQGGHVATVKLLLDRGADPNASGPGGVTPLLALAGNTDSAECARLLAEKGADVTRTNNDGWNPLMLAVYHGHPGVVESLISKDSSANDRALLVAALVGHESVVRILLDHGASVHARTEDGDTPLILAVRNGHEGVARLLVARGADRTTPNNAGETASSLAAARNDPAWPRLLEETPVERTSPPPVEEPVTVAEASPAAGENPPPVMAEDGSTEPPTIPAEPETITGTAPDAAPTAATPPAIERQWTMTGYHEAQFPYILERVANGTATLASVEDGSVINVKKGDILENTNYKVIGVRHRVSSSKEAASVDMSSVSLENAATGDVLSLTVGMPARAPSSYALVRVEGERETLKLRNGQTFTLPSDPSRSYEVVDLRSTQVVIRDETTGQVTTVSMPESTP